MAAAATQDDVRDHGQALRRHRSHGLARPALDTAGPILTRSRLVTLLGPGGVRREIPNIRAALSNAVLTQDTDTGLITAVNLSRSRVWFFVGSMPEDRYWLRSLLKQRQNTGLRLPVLATGAWIASCQGDKRCALSIIADCLRAGRRPASGTEDITATMIAFAKGAYQLFCGNDFPGATTNFARARDGLLRAGFFGDAQMARLRFGDRRRHGRGRGVSRYRGLHQVRRQRAPSGQHRGHNGHTASPSCATATRTRLGATSTQACARGRRSATTGGQRGRWPPWAGRPPRSASMTVRPC
jgi:hypothetical protein